MHHLMTQKHLVKTAAIRLPSLKATVGFTVAYSCALSWYSLLSGLAVSQSCAYILSGIVVL